MRPPLSPRLPFLRSARAGSKAGFGDPNRGTRLFQRDGPGLHRSYDPPAPETNLKNLTLQSRFTPSTVVTRVVSLGQITRAFDIVSPRASDGHGIDCPAYARQFVEQLSFPRPAIDESQEPPPTVA